MNSKLSITDTLGREKSLADNLLAWYWKYGTEREGNYRLPADSWVRDLHEASEGFSALEFAAKQKRPAMAIWGPSQTGKSTSLTSFIDANASFSGDVATDGVGGGMSWEGGTPAFFFDPCKNTYLFPDQAASGVKFATETVIFNPHRSGGDASACVSRFVAGSLADDSNRFFVRDTKHPVQIVIGRSKDLLQTLARGHNSQCEGKKFESAGPEPIYMKAHLNIEKFREIVGAIQVKNRILDREPLSREAFDILADLCDVLDDLVRSGISEFKELGTPESSWKEIKRFLFSDKCQFKPAKDSQYNPLIRDPEVALDLVNEMLFDGYPYLGTKFKLLSSAVSKLDDMLEGRPLMCSLEIAAYLVDMGATKVLFYSENDSRLQEAPRDAHLWKRMQGAKFVDGGDYVYLTCDPEGARGEPMMTTPEDFAVFQSLVWELIVPLNLDNLGEGALRNTLAEVDVMDFPGTEGGAGTSDKSKVNLTDMAEQFQAGQHLGKDFNDKSAPIKLYTHIIKRGKTSCITLTYAKTMTITGFNVLWPLNVRGTAGDEINEGISAWRRYSSSQIDGAERYDPPLNFCLLWWAQIFNQVKVFNELKGDIHGASKVSESRYSTAFAMNYFFIEKDRTGSSPEDLNPAVEKLYKDDVFTDLYPEGSISRQSFEAMTRDRDQGGTEFFYNVLREQARNAWVEQGDGRKAMLEGHYHYHQQALSRLLSTPGFIPVEKPLDVRAKTLKQSLESFRAAIKDADKTLQAAAAFVLRNLFDVGADSLAPIPTTARKIDEGHVREQLNFWYDSKVRDFSESDPGWIALGLNDASDYQKLVRAIMESIVPRVPEVSVWLRELVHHRDLNSVESGDLRRHLARKLANCIDPVTPTSQSSSDSDEVQSYEASSIHQLTLSRVLGDGGILDNLISLEVNPIKRIDQPGDDELKELIKSYPDIEQILQD